MRSFGVKFDSQLPTNKHIAFVERRMPIDPRDMSVAQRQNVGLGIERSRVRNSLVPSCFSLRQGN